MLNDLSPMIDQWYRHQDKGQPFLIVAIDDDAEAIEIQFFDGTLEEISFSDWAGLNIEECEEPDSWAGAIDDMDANELDEISSEFMELDDNWGDTYEHMG